MRIVFYRAKDGKEPALDYIESLDFKQAQKVTWVLDLIEDLEERVPSEYFKKLPSTHGIWEIRISFAGNIFRLLSFFDVNDGSLVVVAHGFTKKTQNVPTREIRVAERRKREYER